MEQELKKALEAFTTSRVRPLLARKSADEYKHSDVLAPLRPVLYVAAPSLITAFVYLAIIGSLACVFPAGVLVLLLGYYTYSYGYWRKRDPDRLQSEQYRLDAQILGLVAEEKSLPPQVADALYEVEGEIEISTTDTDLGSRKTVKRVIQRTLPELEQGAAQEAEEDAKNTRDDDEENE